MPRRMYNKKLEKLTYTKQFLEIISFFIYKSFFENIDKLPCFEKIKNFSYFEEKMLDSTYYKAYLESRMIYDVENTSSFIFEYLSANRNILSALFEIDSEGFAYFSKYIIILWIIMISAHYVRLKQHMNFIKAAEFATNRILKKQCDTWEFIIKNISNYQEIENICLIADKLKTKINKKKISYDKALVILVDNIEKNKDLFRLIFEIKY